MKIAIVGTGISGLVSAYLLSSEHELTIYEANDYVGGHTNTVEVSRNGRTYQIDTGFIVFNRDNYPNFDRLLNRLGVESQPSDMSFSVRCERTGLEYNGTSLNSLFAQRSNLFRPRFYRLVRDIIRFLREAPLILKTQDYDLSLGDYLRGNGYSNQFIDKHIVPMGSAIWSSGGEAALRIPARFFIQFFKNHGFLNLKKRPHWRVIKGGSARYVEKMVTTFRNRIRLSSPVVRIRRKTDRVEVTTGNGETEHFDSIVIATHSDQALRMLLNPTPAESEVLGSIPYKENQVILHTDSSLLPRRPLARASWNAHILPQDPGSACVTYYLNSLQSIDSEFDFCVTLNRSEAIAPTKILRRFTYSHPVYNRKALAAQARWREVNRGNRTFYCGAYWGYGFHEDGVASALRVCEQFGKGL